MIDYAEEIKVALKFYKVKQKEFSRKSGLNEQYVNDIIHGKTSVPRLQCLIPMAKTYKRIMAMYGNNTRYLRTQIGNNILLDIIDLLDNRSKIDTDMI